MKDWVNISSVNDLVPDGTKPLPEPMLIKDYWHPSQCDFIENAYEIFFQN